MLNTRPYLRLWCTLLCAMFLTFGAADGYGSPSEAFQQAREAHGDGNLPLAAVLFLEALQQREAEPEGPGPSQQAIRYNLGVTLFQLGDAESAATQFEALAEDPDWLALAAYNLGLIELHLDQTARARRQFERALQHTDDDDLRQLTLLQLERLRALSEAEPTPVRAPWQLLVELGAGRDDNVRLTGDTEPDLPSDEADGFGELLALGSRRFERAPGAAVRLDLLGYYRGYQSLDTYNLGMVGGTLWYLRDHSVWQTRGGLHLDTQFAGGDHYASTATVHLEAGRPFGPITARLRNSFSHIEGSSDFDFISGWQNRSRLSLHLETGPVRWQASYQLELNDRNDLAFEDAFFSYSATRHLWQLRAQTPLSQRTRLEAQLAYRDSSHNDANTARDDDDNLLQTTREETRITGKLRLSFQPADGWSLFAEYQQQDNDANVQRYDYSSRQWHLGLEVWR